MEPDPTLKQPWQPTAPTPLQRAFWPFVSMLRLLIADPITLIAVGAIAYVSYHRMPHLRAAVLLALFIYVGGFMPFVWSTTKPPADGIWWYRVTMISTGVFAGAFAKVIALLLSGETL